MTERTAVHPDAVVYTVDQFCALHAISRDKFYDLVKRGNLAAFKFGRRTYVAKEEAERWLSEIRQRNRLPTRPSTHPSGRVTY
jgi:excisionase family DNA binding protein